MINFLKSFYLTSRIFSVLGVIAGLFAVSFAAEFLFIPAQIILLFFIILFAVDIIHLYSIKKPTCIRQVPNLLSLSDSNRITIYLENQSKRTLYINIVDELPFQLQKRNFEINLTLKPKKNSRKVYFIKPLTRGRYQFGKINLFISSLFGLAERRAVYSTATEVAVYPSLIQMKKYEFMAFKNNHQMPGMKKIRKIGHSMEFEQIKTYVQGDDYRSINWKATGKKSEIMVNQYDEEKSQQIYCAIDIGRNMYMPFGGMSLLDYAVNASLTLSNIALNKYDKPGLLTFAHKIGSYVKAENKKGQIRHIMNRLYHINEQNYEADYDLLYTFIRKGIPHRSLIVLFSNFESYHSIERNLSVLRKINKRHLLVVVFFVNTEIQKFSQVNVENMEGIYNQIIAHKFINDKKRLTMELRNHGIHTIYTTPQELSVNTINKYLELKAKGRI